MVSSLSDPLCYFFLKKRVYSLNTFLLLEILKTAIFISRAKPTSDFAVSMESSFLLYSVKHHFLSSLIVGSNPRELNYNAQADTPN